MFLIASVLLCIGGWILNRKNVNIAFLSIGVDYFQILAMFANSKVQVMCRCVQFAQPRGPSRAPLGARALFSAL